MNKYDYGYELTEHSTNSWAFERIPGGSTVLELGPSNGNLIYHLTTQKGCVADIVEIDAESGQEAARFARIACIGTDEGNLEKSGWYHKLEGNRYDYIIVLDVLEHIRNPKEVLALLSSLLKEGGRILLSIPNIAHNSVIINLLQNKLEYTDVGLLDDTHVHFYTYQSALRLLKDAGLSIDSCEVNQIAVNNNEIDAAYGTLPREVEAYLKTRNQGTAYQFLFTVSRASGTPGNDPKPLYRRDTLYMAAAFDGDGTLISEQNVNPQDGIRLVIPMSPDSRKIRIDPLDSNCIISDVRLAGKRNDNESVDIPIAESTGNQFGERYVFYDDDPQLYADIPAGLDAVIFSCHIDVSDSSALALLAPSRDIFRQLGLDYVQARGLYENAQNTIHELNLSIGKSNDENLGLQRELNLANSDIAELKEKLEAANIDIAGWKQKLEAANVNMADLNGKLGTANTDIANLNGKLEAANIDIADLRGELEAANNDIADLRGKLKAANIDIANLQNELNAMLNTIWGKIYYKLKK